MIWNTEIVDGRKQYTSTVGAVVFTIAESGKQFILSVEITIKDNAIKLYTDRCGSLEECRTAAEWHLWELSEDTQRFTADINAALRKDKIL